jgi:hypothetical protein
MAVWLLCILLASCAIAAQETPLPPTATPVPTTQLSGPTDCEEVEGNCLELTFTGEGCIYEGPTDLKPGPVAVFFHHEGDGWAAANLIRLLEDKTLEDLRYLIGEEPSTQHQPSWSEHYPGVWKEIRAGESHFWEVNLEPGIHALFCVRTAAWPEPINVWFGKTWTIDY